MIEDTPHISFMVRVKGQEYLISVDLTPWDDEGWWVGRLYVPPPVRRMGFATMAMDRLCCEADRQGMKIFLQSSPYGPTAPPIHILDRFYESFGFVFGNDGLGVRQPRPAHKGPG